MKNLNHLSNTSELYSYKLKLKAHDTIVMKIDSLIKRKINHQVDIAISLREMIEHLETKKLNHIWFREKLERKLQLKELFTKKEEKTFNRYVDEFYLEYLLKVRELIKDQKQEVTKEEAERFDELFQETLDEAIFEMVDNDHCIHEKAANEFIQLAKNIPSKKSNIDSQPIISNNLLKKIKGNEQAKNNIALTALVAIGKSLPPPRPGNQVDNKDQLNEYEHNSLICSRLCNTISSLKLNTMPLLNSSNEYFDRAINYFKELKNKNINSPYISPEQAKLLVDSLNKSKATPILKNT